MNTNKMIRNFRLLENIKIGKLSEKRIFIKQKSK